MSVHLSFIILNGIHLYFFSKQKLSTKDETQNLICQSSLHRINTKIYTFNCMAVGRRYGSVWTGWMAGKCYAIQCDGYLLYPMTWQEKQKTMKYNKYPKETLLIK